MICQNNSEVKGDCLELNEAVRYFDATPLTWLAGQGVQFLNTAGKEGELGYQHVCNLIRECKETREEIINLYRQVPEEDVSLRWSLLYLLSDVGDEAAADFLLEIAVEALPEIEDKTCCEGPRDGEILIRTMAIEALEKIAQHQADTHEHILKVIAQSPDQPILIEAVKAAVKLGLKDKVAEILPKEHHWILDIRQARTEEIMAEPEREDSGERSFTPPKLSFQFTTPDIACHYENKEG